MKNMNQVLFIGAVLFASNCTGPGQGNTGNADTKIMAERPKTFKTAAEAGKAAQADMLAAMEQKVDFGVDKEALRAAEPGTEINIMTLDPAILLKGDTGVLLSRVAKSEGNLIVPFVANGNVAAVASLTSSGGEFKITGLGEKFLTTELKMIYEMNQKLQGNLSIVQIDNLNATVYIIRDPRGDSMNNPQGGYVLSSYNGHNLREPLNEREFISVLAKDARAFMELNAEKLKKGNLVR